MRVVFSCGNAPGLPTGYGGQCLLALRALLDAGCQVALLSWNLGRPAFQPFTAYSTEDVLRIMPHMSKALETRDAAHVPWGSVQWYCNPYTQFPAPIQKADLNRIIADWNADLFVSLQDIFMFQPGAFLCAAAVWMPLHFLPVEHPTVLSLADFDLQLPISGWGALLLEQLHGAKHGPDGKETLRHIDVVPHGRNPEVFRVDSSRRVDTRAKWGWPEDAFVVLLIASNSEESGRKAFDAQIQAFQRFAAKEPRAWLHIHSEVARAYDMGRLLETFGAWSKRSSFIDFGDHRARTHGESTIRGHRVSVSKAQQLLNVSEEELVHLYNAADCLLAASCSEGCGVPILEAQMCGLPVVTTRATAMWEETMFGLSVEPEQWIARMDFNSGWWLPPSKALADALLTISSWSPEERQKRRDEARPRVVAAFSDDTVMRKWGEVVAQVKAELESEFSSNILKLNSLRRAALRLATVARRQWRTAREAADELELQTRVVMGQQSRQAAAQALRE